MLWYSDYVETEKYSLSLFIEKTTLIREVNNLHYYSVLGL